MPATIWFAPWKSGPAEHTGEPGGAAVVSVTDFAPHRPWTSVGINIAGAALRHTWGDVEGAVGLWLWSVPGLLRSRSGSVSVWRDERHLRDFVARHDHVRIMNTYRNRGDLRSATWQTEHFDKDATQETARSLIEEWRAQPVR
ncbi:hypothetical protein OG349_04730 [Streptomyces sp. NBC_01317]|uniref:hypothetical protein n=1 Tax=Streptomyces sp. NBC_01317 TaxID=2903822 RepID=UPI002E1218FD|nr:hypothetical protein OG349_04730 [Streptomyces sp. NBC_01317]